MRLGRLPAPTGDPRADAVNELRWATGGAGLTIEKLVEMKAVQRLPAVAEALAGLPERDVPRVAFEVVAAAARDLGDAPHARIMRNALAIGYAGDGKDLTARRAELVREHNDAARRGDGRNLLPETARALYTIEQQVLTALVTALGAPPPGVAGTHDATPLPRQLPAAPAVFVGRDGDLVALDTALGDDEPHAPAVVTVCGQPGVGKTALAVWWAHRVADRFPDGHLWLDLRGHSRAGAPLPPAVALSALLQSLGVRPETLPTDEAGLAGMYRSVTAGRRLLVVLDDAASSEQVTSLVPGDPRCAVLVTSRHALPALAVTHGARSLTLDPLDPEAAGALLGALVDGERIGADATGVSDVAARCGFLPLALRIVAAKLCGERHTSVAEMARRLGEHDRLTALGFGDAGEPAVRGAFELSYSSLPPDEQRAFRLLGLVPGATVPQEGAARLLDVPEPEARRLLERLTSAHLVTEPAAARYGCHDLLRDYAAELTASVDTEEARTAAMARLLDWYTRHAIAATAAVHPRALRLRDDAPDGEPPYVFGDVADAVAWLVAERANATAAVAWAAAQGMSAAAWRLAYAMRGWFLVRPCGAEWLPLGLAGLEAAEADGQLQAVSAMHGLLGRAHRQAGDLDTAAAHVDAAVEASRRDGWAHGEMIAQCTLGGIRMDQGRLDDAIHHHGEALAIERRVGNDGGSVHLHNIAIALFQQGAFADADARSGEALAIVLRHGNDTGRGMVLATRAGARYELARPDDALADAEAALAALGDHAPGAAAEAMTVLARVSADRGGASAAARLVAAARRRAAAADDVRATVTVADAAGAVALRVGRHEAARRSYRSALLAATRAGYRYGEASALAGLAATAVAAGRHDEAARYAGEAVAIATGGGFDAVLGYALAALAEASEAVGDGEGARAARDRAAAVFDARGCPRGRALLLVPA
jgi:tetratricopeptide (TPR) repeat protein